MTKHFRKPGTGSLPDVYNMRIIIRTGHWKHSPALSERLSACRKRLRRTAGNTLSPHGKASSDVRKSLFHNPVMPHTDGRTAQMPGCQGIDKNAEKRRVRRRKRGETKRRHSRGVETVTLCTYGDKKCIFFQEHAYTMRNT